MPFIVEDSFITSQATTHDISELENSAIAIDASYYLKQLLDSDVAHEPLLPALGGLTGIQAHLNHDLDQWNKHKITPFFIFDGQSISGQDEVSLKRGRAANRKTDVAWSQYLDGKAETAVSTFGANPGAFQVSSLFPALQDLLRARDLHFLVAPYNACAQLAYLEMIDSDQCGGVMGPQQLLLYPVTDCIIKNFDWTNNTVAAISKKKLLAKLNINENMFIDGLLMAGTPYLSPFPPLQDTTMYQDSYSIGDAINILRTSDKTVAGACASFNDVLQTEDPEWLDRYRKARMAVHHFIYIAENGEICVNEYERLTNDNHEYLGLQLPAELFHYLNKGLIGARILNYITHSQILIQPTLDGVDSNEYKKLVTEDTMRIREQALGLIIPRVHRGIGHKAITMRTWFDPSFNYTMSHSTLQPSPSQQVGTWDVKEKDVRAFFPADFAGPIAFEVVALANSDFAAKTVAKEKPIRGIDSAEMIVSVAIWRFLHLRGYINDAHELTKWGNALATTLLALRETGEDRPEVPGIDEAALLAFELIRFGLLSGQPVEGQQGIPRKGTEDDKACLVLVSQCAALLKLNHQSLGYTGPLNKSLLTFHSLSSTTRAADRDLVDAIVASMFMYGQCQRERDDYCEISNKLPFSREPDVALGIAFRTFFDDDEATSTKEARAARLKEFPTTFVPYAESLSEDFQTVYDFVDAINKGVQALSSKELKPQEKAAWAKAQEYIDARPF